MSLRILIDLQSAQNGSRHRGIGRYALALTQAIIRNVGKHRVFILLNNLFPETIPQIKAHFAAILPEDRFLVLSFHGPVSELNTENSWRRRAAELSREYSIATLRPDVLLVSSMVEGASDDTVTSFSISSPVAFPTVALIYDLIPLVYGGDHIDGELAQAWYMNKLSALKRVDGLLAISQTTMNDAVRLLNVDPSRIRNISGAADCFFTSPPDSCTQPRPPLNTFGITRKFLMHSSAFEPRKNFQGLLRAFAALPVALRSEYQLVFVSQINCSGREELRSLGSQLGLASNDLILTGYISDEDLRTLYATCHLFIFPSFSEGFGLPPLEAMSCGAATIGSNVSSVREVIGRDDALFDPASDESMTALIYKSLTNMEFYGSLKHHASQQGANFSWNLTADRAIAAMQELVDERISQRTAERSPIITRQNFIESIADIAIEFETSDLELRYLAHSINANDLAVEQLRRCASFRIDT